ncbi:MAG: TolC family protein [Candidatus Korobacteraceae bacterium]|jgi:outer membrane protein TolC
MKHKWHTVFAFWLTAPLLWAQAAPVAHPLSLQEAIQKALQANLSVKVAGTQIDEAAGTRQRRLSALLPHVTGAQVTSYQNRNLRAFGLSLPIIPEVIGPFSNYDWRVFGSQTLIDRQAYHSLKASDFQQDATKLSYQDTRDLVIRQTAGLYLDAESAQAEVDAAESRVTTSKTLLKLAQDQHDSGVATGVDVVRARVQLQRDEQNLLVARDSYDTSILALQRFVGIEPGEPMTLADRLAFHPADIPNVAEALQSALQSRPDYRALFAQKESLVEQQKASRARYLPRLGVDGNYGALGRSYGDMPGIGLIEGTATITIFDRDRKGEAEEITSRVNRVDAQIADLRRGVQQELRKAILDLQSAKQQVSVTQSGVELAQVELGLAQDRFHSGLGDNVEVVIAQSSLQSAQDDHILALARYSDATMALARAMGGTEKNYQSYLGGN